MFSLVLRVSYTAPIKSNNSAAVIFYLRYVLLGPPHDVQSERVNPSRKFLFCLDKWDFFTSVQIFYHHTSQDFLF